MTSNFALEVAKYPRSIPKPQNSQKYCVSLLCRSSSDAACFFIGGCSSVNVLGLSRVVLSDVCDCYSG